MENKTIIFEYIQKLKDKGHSKRFIIKEIMSKYAFKIFKFPGF